MYRSHLIFFHNKTKGEKNTIYERRSTLLDNFSHSMNQFFYTNSDMPYKSYTPINSCTKNIFLYILSFFI